MTGTCLSTTIAMPGAVFAPALGPAALTWGAIGFALGVLLAAVIVHRALSRSARRAIDAERRARASERLAEIGGMTSGLAHEIRNPLSTIGLNAQLLAEAISEQGLPADERSRLLRRIDTLKRETERLRGILEDFLEYAGELRLTLAPRDVAAVVGELADFVLPQCEQNGIRLRTDPPAGSAIAPIDEPHLKQAILNLVLNAIQAMAVGSSSARELILRVRTGQDASRRPVVRVHVIDTGPGIAADVAAKIFQPYFTTKAGGTGLGLPTSRRIIEGHGGTLELHSEPGRGTDFTITLPAERASD
ncbi:MAG: ATP-binding protein [Phycisphaerales bacterium]|nr:ATP-binding protein [Phycisphaerales bacterium]